MWLDRRVTAPLTLPSCNSHRRYVAEELLLGGEGECVRKGGGDEERGGRGRLVNCDSNEWDGEDGQC